MHAAVALSREQVGGGGWGHEGTHCSFRDGLWAVGLWAVLQVTIRGHP